MIYRFSGNPYYDGAGKLAGGVAVAVGDVVETGDELMDGSCVDCGDSR